MNTLIIFITLLSVVNANPSKPGCDLIGNSGKNVMKRTTIMGAVPVDATNLISFSSNKFNATGDVITVTISNLKTGGAVIHTSSGALSASNSEQATPAGYTAKTGCTDKMFYKQGGVGATLTLYLTVPSDITSVSSITVSVLTASGQSTVSRQALSLTNTVTTTTSTAAPTTTTTQGPTPSPGPTTTAGPTTTSTAAPTTTQGPTTSPGPTTTTSAASSTTQGPTSAAASTSTSSMSNDTTTEAEIDIAARATTSSLVLFILPLLTLFYISC